MAVAIGSERRHGIARQPQSDRATGGLAELAELLTVAPHFDLELTHRVVERAIGVQHGLHFV